MSLEAGGEPTRGFGRKIFVGRLPQEATAEDLRQYFGRFGRIADAYVPKVTSKERVNTMNLERILFYLHFNDACIGAGPEKEWSPRIWFCDIC